MASALSQQTFSAAVLICSDRAYSGERPDETLPELKNYLDSIGISLTDSSIVPDDQNKIKTKLLEWIEKYVSLIVTSGGTGLSPSDITPEATLEIINRRIPGMEEEMRRRSLEITPHAMISRAVVGVSGQSLIINLPGNPKGAVDNIKAVQPALFHALELISGGKPDK